MNKLKKYIQVKAKWILKTNKSTIYKTLKCIQN